MTSAESTLIATHSGLRGRPGAGLSDEAVVAAVAGLAELTRAAGRPLVLGLARDGRPGGDRLARLAVDSAHRSGTDVVDFGVVSTPGAKLAARRRGLGGLVVVTASHLGPEYNGLKLAAGPDLRPVDVGRLSPPAPQRRAGGGGLRREAGAPREHAGAVAAAIDTERIRRAGLRVALSGGADAAGRMLLDAIGCATVEGPADIGLQLDADGDRLALFDEHGQALDTEVVLPLIAIARGARRIVKGADTSRMVDAVAAEHGGEVRTVDPGELHLVEEMAQSGADLAGEGNGGVVLPVVGAGRDGLAAGAAILELLASSGEPVSRLAAALPRLFRRRSTVPCGSPADALGVLARLGAAPSSDPHVGVQMERPGATWALARLSATEPVLRLTVEAPEAAAADALHAELRAVLAAASPLAP